MGAAHRRKLALRVLRFTRYRVAYRRRSNSARTTCESHSTDQGELLMNSSASQTRSFTTVFLVEMWERFGYYGMGALLVLYMVERLGFGDARANLTWGAFTAL